MCIPQSPAMNPARSISPRRGMSFSIGGLTSSSGARQGEPEPKLFQRIGQAEDLLRTVKRPRGEPDALSTPRHGGIVNRLNVDREFLKQGIGEGLAANWIAYDDRHDV